MTQTSKLLLVVLDGWGIRPQRDGNAILLAGTPHLDRLSLDFPASQLEASGLITVRRLPGKAPLVKRLQ